MSSFIRPERVVASVLREQARDQRAVRARRVYLLRLQMASVLALGQGFVRGWARDIFGLDELLCDRATASRQGISGW